MERCSRTEPESGIAQCVRFGEAPVSNYTETQMSSSRNPTMSLAVLPNDHAKKKLFVKTVETRTFLHARERKQMHFVSPKLQVALTTRGKISRVWGQQAQRAHWRGGEATGTREEKSI